VASLFLSGQQEIVIVHSNFPWQQYLILYKKASASPSEGKADAST
jgi:hypothetical protein